MKYQMVKMDENEITQENTIEARRKRNTSYLWAKNTQG